MHNTIQTTSVVRQGLLGLANTLRSARARVRLPVLMTVRPDLKVKAVIEDLSKDGVRLRSRVILHEGQVVSLEMPREIIACEIRWVLGFNAGGILLTEQPVAEWRPC